MYFYIDYDWGMGDFLEVYLFVLVCELCDYWLLLVRLMGYLVLIWKSVLYVVLFLLFVYGFFWESVDVMGDGCVFLLLMFGYMLGYLSVLVW